MQGESALPADTLADEPRQFQLLVQSVKDYAIYMLDPNGFVRSWNDGGYRIKGYTASEIVGEHFSKFYLPEDADAGIPQRNLQTARSQGKFEAESWRVRKDGSHFRASCVIDPIYQAGQLVGYAKITRDITERYDSQAKLLEAEREVMAAQKDQAIGKLTYGLAHDFNNLLAVLVNTLDLVARQAEATPKIKRLLDTGMQAAERGALLTRQLLTFARGQTLAPEIRDINDLLSASEEIYRRGAGSTITLQLNLEQGLPAVLVDAAQFEAGILNLVSNSRDAMPRGGNITISTSLLRLVPPSDPTGQARDFICITVADNGTGMSEEAVRRGSEPFFTTKEVGRGSGLGLSQVFGFAAQSGGFAAIDSQLGLGTAIRVCLPVMGR